MMDEKILQQAMQKHPVPAFKTTTEQKVERTLKILEEYRKLKNSGKDKPEQEAA